MRYRHDGPKWKSDPEKMKSVVKGLGELARSKAAAPAPDTPAVPATPAPGSRVRRLTQEETEALFGHGLVVLGGKKSPG